MSVSEAYSGGDGFVATPSRAERRQQRVIDRLTDRVAQAADEGKSEYEVMGGLRELFATAHDPKVYVEVAAQLREQEPPIEVEVYRLTGQHHMPAASFDNPMAIGAETIYTQDIISIRAIGGTALQPEPYHGPEMQTWIYPPEDLDGLHNLSITG